jgi:hypothetical protein
MRIAQLCPGSLVFIAPPSNFEGAGMRISQVFVQGGGYGYADGYGCGCDDWDHNGAYRPTGYFYRRGKDGYYCYNDGCGYNPRPHGGLLGLL